MIRRGGSGPVLVALVVLVVVAACRCAAADEPVRIEPAHGRPFFMPDQKRREILALATTEPWAAKCLAALEAAARPKGPADGRAAAFLYALRGEAEHAATAERWLMGFRGTPRSHRALLADPAYWRQGQPMNSEVHYGISVDHYVAFDWAYRGLSEQGRRAIEEGLAEEARFRMKWLDTWRFTPNLEFKPLFMAAFGGLALQDQAALHYLRGRTERHGSYFSMMDRLLRDGGPWHEAPIYAIQHSDLLCMATMSFYGRLATGADWFSARTPGGGSPRGLMDYYIDTAYPPESDAAGNRRIRVATYGDGATHFDGDLFLVDATVGADGTQRPATPATRAAREALIACYRASDRDPAYGAFVSMLPGYEPDLWNRPPLPDPDARAFPPAPSRVWPTFGVAMLRSIESPAYWTDPDAIAAFQLMTPFYGHDHADKFAIMLHGAGALLYPDFNAIQYENYAIGWTRNTVAHSTLMVDEEDTQPAPCTVRHDFTPEVKFLATAASGVYEGVDQTRALLLTDRYLLDLFAARSPYPRVYDYLLHSMGRPEPVTAGFGPDVTASRRFWPLEQQRGLATAEPWQLDFAVDGEAPGSARVRVTMAGAAGTRVVCGSWGRRLAEKAGNQPAAAANAVGPSMLAARRGPVRGTVFAATHEPFRARRTPAVRGVEIVAEGDDAAVVRVDGEGFTDYAAVDFRPRTPAARRMLVDRSDPDRFFAFEGYGFLRIPNGGDPIARGGWTAYRVETADGAAVTSGKREDMAEERPTAAADPSVPLRFEPGVVRLGAGREADVRFSFTNSLPDTIHGSLDCDASQGIAPVGDATFGPVPPGGTATVAMRLTATADTRPGLRRIPCRLRYRTGPDAAERTTLHEPLTVAVGPTLIFDHAAVPEPRYRILAPGYTAESMMFHGLLVRLAGPDGTVILDNEPMFTFAEEGRQLLHRGQKHGCTWPKTAPASLIGMVEEQVRYTTAFLDDRVRVGLVNEWTYPERVRFRLPGTYAWPKDGAGCSWKRIIAVTEAGDDVDARPGKNVTVAAAELELPGLPYGLAIEFQPPRPVDFDGQAVEFTLAGDAADHWSFGFCPAGGLESWRSRR